MITQDQLTKFGRDKAGYSYTKAKKPENGDLYLDGKRLFFNLPFALLQSEKRKLILSGYTSKRIKIKYNGRT